MKWNIPITFIFACAFAIELTANPMLTFFFRDYPADEAMAQQMVTSLKNPHHMAACGLESIMNCNKIAGIFCSYFGYLEASGIDGQVVFPLKQSKPSLDVYISNKITPIVMFENTVSHWELQPGVPAKHYFLKFSQDPVTKITYWDVQDKKLPDDGKIPAEGSLIIIAAPDNIYVPLGITPAPKDPNLILPNFYVKRGIQSVTNALNMLHLTHYFRPVDILYKKSKKRYGEMVSEY